MFQNRKHNLHFRAGVLLTLFSFLLNLAVLPPKARAQLASPSGVSVYNLPAPGEMIGVTPSYVPPMLKGMRVDSTDPFAFDFLLDSGNADLDQSALKRESVRLIKYFLAALTIPENDLWVNLSSYEKDRIISNELGMTEMGRDLLSQDYILKQLTASLIYPEKELGQKFWDKVYAKAYELYGTSDIPVETFSKVWVVPDKAVVYESGDAAYIVDSHLKVILEEDYVALAEFHGGLLDSEVLGDRLMEKGSSEQGVRTITSQIIRDVVLPEIEKEVNEGQNFSRLRQVYSSLILAKWYKQNLRQSILNREYADQKKIVGVDVDDKTVKEKIYEQYLKAYKKGVFNYIKENYDPITQEVIPRKYFSGGLEMRVPLEEKTDPETLARLKPEGKLNWINGVYRQPRVSARYVNEYVAGQFNDGKARAGAPISLSNGGQAKVYLIEGLLRATGQFGHVGLGAKERKGEAIVYEENGIPVVYLDSQYADDARVRANEHYKVEKWEEQKSILGQERGLGRSLTALEMREWIKGNFIEAAELLRKWDIEAPSLDDLFRKAQSDGQLPSQEAIAGTYVRADDFSDLNLAGGKTADWEELIKIPNRKLQNTSAIFENVILFVKRLDSPNVEMRIRGINRLDWLINNKLADKKVIIKFKLVEKLVKSLGDGDYDIRAAAARVLGYVLDKGGDIDDGISALVKSLGDGERLVRIAAAMALGDALEKGGDIGAAVLSALVKSLEDGDDDVREAAVMALGHALDKGGDIGDGISALVKSLEDGDDDVRAAAAMALGDALEKDGDIGDDGIRALVKLLEDGEYLVREVAARALGHALEKGVDIGDGISALVKSLGDGEYLVGAAAAAALGHAVEKGGDIGAAVLSALVKSLRDGDDDVRAAVAMALGHALEKDGDIGDGISALVKSLEDRNYDVREAAAKALGYALEKDGDIGDDGIRALVKLLEDENYNVRAAAAMVLGHALEKGGGIGAAVLSALVKSLGDGEHLVRVAAARALGHALEKGGDIGDGISVLVKSLGDGEHFVRVAAAAALGHALEKGGDIGDDGIRALVVKLLEDGEHLVRVAAARALGDALEKRGNIGDDGISALVKSLGDGNYLVREAAARALGHALEKDGDLGDEIGALVKLLEDVNYSVGAAAARALGHALEKGKLETLTEEEVTKYYLLVQKERKNRGISSNKDINSRLALVLKIYSVVVEKIDSDDVEYLGRIADVTEDRDSLALILDTLRSWSVGGSSDAQNFFEGRVGQIVERRLAQGKKVVDITEKDEALIEATAGSFRQRSLFPILTGEKFPVGIREKVLLFLTQRGYIDSGYSDVAEKDLQIYLYWISEVFDAFKIVAPKILVEDLINHKIKIEELKSRKSELDPLLEKHDHRVLIEALVKDDYLLLLYYMLHQSPFQYPGADPISFERFESLVHGAFEKQKHEQVDIVEKKLVEGYVEAGLDIQQAREIADALLKGRPPLPKDSPYLDKNGNFIPQMVDVIAMLGDSDGKMEKEQDSFRSSVNGIVMVLKINDLSARILKGIEKKRSASDTKKTEWKNQYDKIVLPLSEPGVDLTKIFDELMELNDQVFPPEGRKRDINGMIARAINYQMLNTPMCQSMLNIKKGAEKGPEREEGRIYLEDWDINALVHNSDRIVNALKARQKAGKLTEFEKRIIEDGQEIKAEQVIKIFFAEFIERLNIKNGSPLHPIFQDLETRAIAAFNNYAREVISQHVNLQKIPQVVYVDFVSKFNLLEFFRFADGAHCCLTSDPKVGSQYGPRIYEREMPRYIANATSFWWQVTTDYRAGKQIGWYENWMGLESNKVFVGTELIYMPQSYHDRDLQTAILAKVEEVLFSTKVTKIAQAIWGHQATNALTPPPAYQEQEISMVKLQSLKDGNDGNDWERIYEDNPVESNWPVKKTFKVKNNPGELKTNAAVLPLGGDGGGSFVQGDEKGVGGIDFNFDLLELEIQGEAGKWSLPSNMNSGEYIHIENGLLPVIINIRPAESIPFIFGAVDIEHPHLSGVR